MLKLIYPTKLQKLERKVKVLEQELKCTLQSKNILVAIQHALTEGKDCTRKEILLNLQGYLSGNKDITPEIRNFLDSELHKLAAKNSELTETIDTLNTVGLDRYAEMLQIKKQNKILKYLTVFLLLWLATAIIHIL